MSVRARKNSDGLSALSSANSLSTGADQAIAPESIAVSNNTDDRGVSRRCMAVPRIGCCEADRLIVNGRQISRKHDDATKWNCGDLWASPGGETRRRAEFANVCQRA